MRRALPGGAPEGPTTRHQWQRCPTWRGPHYRYIRSPADSARKLPDLIRGTAHDMTLELLVDDSFQQRRRIVERKHVGPAGMTSGSDLHHDQIYEARTWLASAKGGEIGTRSHSVGHPRFSYVPLRRAPARVVHPDHLLRSFAPAQAVFHRNLSRPDADVDVLEGLIADVFNVVGGLKRHECHCRSGDFSMFSSHVNASRSGHHKIHLNKTGVSVRRCGVSCFDGFHGSLEALRVIPGNKHGVKVSRTPELLAFV